MRSAAATLAASALFLTLASPALAQPDRKPHMELVRGLRNNGLASLALQYLDELKGKNPPPEIAVLLPLEYARTWLELAAQEPEEGKRAKLIKDAKRELNVFISANPKHPQARQANVDLARLMSLQAKGQLTKARRIENPEARRGEMTKARNELKLAADKYEATAKAIEEQLKQLEADQTPEGAALRKELTQFRLRSQIDQGINLFDMGETYDSEESGDVIARGDQFKAAKKVFEKVMYQDDKESLCWVARAWAAESDYKAGDMESATRSFQDLMNKKASPAAAAGVRVARYFGIFHSFEKNDKLDARGKLLKAQKEAADWLRDYAGYRNSAEGVGARYYLAFVRMELGKTGVQRDKSNKITGITPTAKADLEESARLFKDITESENEYTEKANRYRSQILVTIADGEGHGDAPPPETLGTFERCYLMAQVQTARFIQFKQARLNPPVKKEPEAAPEPKAEPKKGPAKKDAKEAPRKDLPVEKEPQPKAAADPKKIEEEIAQEERRRFTNAINYLEYGLARVTPKDSIRDVFNAQLFLVGCYYQMKLYPQAAVLADYVAHSYPTMTKASSAGMIAVECYNVSFNKFRGKDPAPEPEALAADVGRLRRAAQYVVSQWPEETSSDEARHILGFFLARDKQLGDAWKAYAEIKAGYPAVQSARLELGSIMFSLIYPADEKDATRFNQIVKDRIKEHQAQWTRTLELLEATPEPDEGCPHQDAVAYLESRGQLARLYQLEGKQDRAQPVADAMVKAAAKFTSLKDNEKANYAQAGQNIQLNTVRALAYEQFKAGNHAKVAELLNTNIEAMQKEFGKDDGKEPTPAQQRLRKTQRDILVLALQSSVQDQKIDRASELLDLLEKSGNSAEGSLGLLQTLAVNVRNQIDQLEKDGKKEEAKGLKQGFTTLLDKIRSQGDKLPNNMKLFLAQGYQRVEAYKEASALLDQIRKSPAPPKPADPGKDAPEDQVTKYQEAKAAYDNHEKFMHQASFLLARNHRAAKDYDAALKLLTEAVGPAVTSKTPTPPPAQRGWAFAAMEVRKEKAHVLEERAKSAPAAGSGGKSKAALWAEAVQEWIAIQTAFAPRLTPVKELGLASLEKKLTPEELKKYATLAVEQKQQFVLAKANLNAADQAKYDGLPAAAQVAFIEQRMSPEALEKYRNLSGEKKQQFLLGKMTAAEQGQFAQEQKKTTDKRAMYFELYFDQKRCSVKAFADIGPSATKGDKEAYAAKFTKFAQDFHDLVTKNKDLPTELKDRIKELIDETPLLKQEYKKVAATPVGGTGN
jgi:hypothetical protein